MNSLIEISRSGIKVAQEGLNTTAHNITNANTPGYTRRRLITVPQHQIGGKGLQGLGVKSADFEYLRELRTESLIQTKQQELSYLEVKSQTFARLETSFVSDTGGDLDARTQSFLQSFGNLASSPQSRPARNQVIQEAELFIDAVKNVHSAIEQERELTQNHVQESIRKVNRLLEDLDGLNKTITSALNRGEQALAAMDTQVMKLQELSEYLDIKTVQSDNGQVRISVGGMEVLSPDLIQQLQLTKDSESEHLDIRLANSGQGISVESGKLGALLELNNDDLVTLSTDLDGFVSNLVQRVNFEHSQGYGLEDTQPRNFFSDMDGSASTLSIEEDLINNIDHIAAESISGVQGNGDIAEAIAGIKDSKIMSGYAPVEFAIHFISSPGSKVSALNEGIDLRNSEMELLTAQQQQVSGVNMDEELSNMIQYQQAYQGAAKVLESAQIMYQTLMSIVA